MYGERSISLNGRLASRAQRDPTVSATASHSLSSTPKDMGVEGCGAGGEQLAKD